MILRLFNLDQFSTPFSKFLNLLVWPFLIGFLLDLPWTGQLLISLTFVFATVVVRDFVDALLCLWQAIAVAGLFFVLLDYATVIKLNRLVCALSIPVVWIFILFFKKYCAGGVAACKLDYIQTEIIGVASVALLLFVVPRGQLQNLSFLAKGEDSALYMWSSSELLRGQKFNLATSFGASSYLYFYTFLNNGFLFLSQNFAGSDSESLLISLNVLSNAWVFVLVSSILFSIRIAFMLKQRISDGTQSFGLLAVISVSSFLYFRASQDVGHFTQYLLNCATMVFLLTLMSASIELKIGRKFGLVLLALATALALVGSYGPWLPITLIGIALAINVSFHKSILRYWFASKYWLTMVLIFVIGWAIMLRKLYTSSNLEMAGGVAVVPLEAVWLVLALSVSLLASLFIGRINKLIRSGDVGSVAPIKWDSLVIFSSAIIVSFALIVQTSFNQLTTLSFVVLAGLIFRPSAYKNLMLKFGTITAHHEFDGIFILAFTTFLYGFSIYMLSRFIGPIYEPMYAGNKSMFAVFGQYSWLLFLLFINGSTKLSWVPRIIKNSTMVAAFLIVFGQINFIRYDEVQTQWWHKPFLEAINENPDALVACVNPILTTDYESYKCNHFVATLSKNNNSVLFERLSLGDPGLIGSIRDRFNGNSPENTNNLDNYSKVVVLSQADLNLDALSMFDGVPKNRINFVVVSS